MYQRQTIAYFSYQVLVTDVLEIPVQKAVESGSYQNLIGKVSNCLPLIHLKLYLNLCRNVELYGIIFGKFVNI
jgi:hypothetical protein